MKKKINHFKGLSLKRFSFRVLSNVFDFGTLNSKLCVHFCESFTIISVSNCKEAYIEVLVKS